MQFVTAFFLEQKAELLTISAVHDSSYKSTTSCVQIHLEFNHTSSFSVSKYSFGIVVGVVGPKGSSSKSSYQEHTQLLLFFFLGIEAG